MKNKTQSDVALYAMMTTEKNKSDLQPHVEGADNKNAHI